MLLATGGRVPEICEIGEQGGLIVDLYSLVPLGTLVLVTVKSFNPHVDELPTAKVACKKAASNRRFCGDRQGPAKPESSYLVDPASSHMLVSKIKPCMSKYKQLCTVKLRMAH